MKLNSSYVSDVLSLRSSSICVIIQVKEEPLVGGGGGRLQRRLSETNTALLPSPSIPCEACDATFDSRQMKNDHFLLMHPAPPPPPPPKTPLSPLADDDVTADDKVTWFIWDTV